MASEMLDQQSLPKIVVTGATGYIGERLVVAALAQGFDVIALSRRAPDDSRVSWFRFDLAEPSVEKWPEGVVAVIHLAAQTGPSITLSAQEEIRAADNLMQAARRGGARFVFVSSQTARPEAPSSYGRVKAAIEERVMASGGTVVRPGQVYGGPLRGLFGKLQRAAKQLPVLPRFVPAPLVQPIHVDDLAKGLMLVATSASVASRVYCLGAAEPVSFAGFLDALARCRVRRNRIFLPIPQFAVRLFARVLGASASQRLGLEQLLSLFELPLMATRTDLQLLGLEARSLEDGMTKSGHGLRRRQILEGRTLLWYVLRQRPTDSLSRRYVRVLASMNKATTLRLPRWMNRFPGLLAIADEPGFRRSRQGAEFDWRLDAATLIAEASPQGAVRFLGSGQCAGFPGAVMLLACAVLLEIVFRLVGIVLRLSRSRPLIEEGQ
jgi:NADH dehydrogenase